MKRDPQMSIHITETAGQKKTEEQAPLNNQMASVLVVDGETVIRNLLQRGLQTFFGLVETAESVESAEQLRQRCLFDLIIVDIRMPGRSGVEWIADLRQQGESTAVIFMTGNADLETAISALRLGADDFILKPFRMEQMLAAVERYLQRRQLQRDNYVLQRQVNKILDSSGLVGDCAQMNSICQVINRVAPMPSTVLIEGESGTGKELAARAIHEQSGRSGSFVPVNCGAISTELLESELFGHQKGAFTGAHQARDGLFSYANGGTLFLDEIGEMPLGMQAHLLRVLEERNIRPVGANQLLPVDVRVVAATHRDLAQLVHAGEFREDLYYRLNVLAIRMPPLRERPDDIRILTRHFLDTLATELGVDAPALAQDELSRLYAYHWPGNVRELKNVVERSLLLNISPSQCLTGPANHHSREAAESDEGLRLETVEKRHILKVLKREGGNKSAAARILGVSRKTLERKVQAWGE
jgi:two-component system NtrC family response regulator